MQITVDKSLTLIGGLKALDGHNKIIKNGENESVAAALFNFSGVTRMVIARNIAALEVVAASYTKARNDLIKQFAGPEGNSVPAEKTNEFLSQDIEMRTQMEEVALTKIKQADLNLDDNPIPGSVLSQIVDLIEGG